MADIHELSAGQVVFSKCGRDKGLPFIVIRLDGGFAYIADGGLRKLEKPKKKKLKHLQPVKYVDAGIGLAIGSPEQTDADIRKALKPFKKNSQ